MPWQPVLGTQPLAPFDHQVAGQSSMLRYDTTTVCKPLIAREHFVYKTLPRELKEFTPEYRGEIEVQLIEEDGYIQLYGLCVGDDEAGEDSVCSCTSILGNHEHKPLLDSLQETTDETSLPNRSMARVLRSGSYELYPSTDEVFYAADSNPENPHTHSLNPWSLKNHKRLLDKMRKSELSDNKIRFLLLKNVVADFRHPCILDLKIGSRLYGDDASSAKVASQSRKCQETTSSTLGVRLCGMQVYQAESGAYHSVDKYHGRTLNDESFKDMLYNFLHNGTRFRSELIQPIVLRLSELIKCLEYLHSFRFYASSLLIIYDGDVGASLETQETSQMIVPDVADDSHPNEHATEHYHDDKILSQEDELQMCKSHNKISGVSEHLIGSKTLCEESKLQTTESHATTNSGSEGHITKDHHDSNIVHQEHHDSSSIHQEDHDSNIVHQECHDSNSVHQEHHDSSSVHQENHDSNSVHQECHDSNSVHQEHHDSNSVHQERHDSSSVHQEDHDSNSVHQEYHDSNSVHQERHDSNIVHQETRLHVPESHITANSDTNAHLTGLHHDSKNSCQCVNRQSDTIFCDTNSTSFQKHDLNQSVRQPVCLAIDCACYSGSMVTEEQRTALPCKKEQISVVTSNSLNHLDTVYEPGSNIFQISTSSSISQTNCKSTHSFSGLEKSQLSKELFQNSSVANCGSYLHLGNSLSQSQKTSGISVNCKESQKPKETHELDHGYVEVPSSITDSQNIPTQEQLPANSLVKFQTSCVKVDVKMIDFAHTTHKGFTSDKIQHVGPDADYILGLKNLMKLFDDLHSKKL